MSYENEFKYDGRILCADDGKPLPITDVDFAERRDGQNGVRPVLTLSAIARAYLVSGSNPSAGTEPVEPPESVSIELDALSGRDLTISLKMISSALGISGDDELRPDDDFDWVMRFDADHPKSVLPLLRERGIYVSAKVKKDVDKAKRYGESLYFFNPALVAKREPVTKASLSDFQKRLRAKKAGVNLDDIGGESDE